MINLKLKLGNAAVLQPFVMQERDGLSSNRQHLTALLTLSSC